MADPIIGAKIPKQKRSIDTYFNPLGFYCLGCNHTVSWANKKCEICNTLIDELIFLYSKGQMGNQIIERLLGNK